jgi:hypothetical protein
MQSNDDDDACRSYPPLPQACIRFRSPKQFMHNKKREQVMNKQYNAAIQKENNMKLTKRELNPYTYRLTKADHDLLKQLEKILKINNTLRRVFRNIYES